MRQLLNFVQKLLCCWNITTDEWKGSWLVDKWGHYVYWIALFLIFLRCRFQGECQGKKQTFECQQHLKWHVHLDRWDADNHRNEHCSVTEHHHKNIYLFHCCWGWKVDGGLFIYLFSSYYEWIGSNIWPGNILLGL